MGLLTRIKDRLSGRVPAGMKRSDEWPIVRKEYLEKHPSCAVCGSLKKVEVHHKIPFHIDPALELNPRNFISLCRSKRMGFNCHFTWGHLNDWKDFNVDVVKDAKDWFEKLMNVRIRKDKK